MQKMNELHEAETDQYTIHFNLTFSLDRDGFMRRTCPSCGRDFKTDASASDFTTELQPYFREAGLDIGDQEEDGNKDVKAFLRCPYCAQRYEASEMLTEELVSYVKRLILREHILPMMNKSFAQIADSFGRRSRNSFVSVTFEHNRSVLPVRPISGPDLPDMTIIDMRCCGKRIKVSDGWYYLNQCPYCETHVLVQN